MTSPSQVSCADSIQALSALENDSVHLILTDIPYGIGADDWDVLHENTNSAYRGNSPAQAKAGAVFKSRGKPINGWSDADRQIPAQYYEWCKQWAPDFLRVLKPGGSAIVFAGRRYAHRCISAMEDSGFSFKDMLSWIRPRAVHRAQRISTVFERRKQHELAEEWKGWRLGNLRPSFEPVLWFQKPYRMGGTIADNVIENGVGAFNEDAFVEYTDGEPENVLRVGMRPKEAGLHPTQKPIELMQALIELTTVPGQVVLDPFCGSGTTLVAAKNLGRAYIGFDRHADYVEIAKRRLDSLL